MAEIDNTYLAKVGFERGGDRLYMKEDGEFKFFDLDVTGTELRSFFRAGSKFNTWSQTSMALTSGAALALVPAYGYHVIKDIAAAESAYMSLSTGKVGDELTLLVEGGVSNGLFTLGFSGAVSLYDIAGAKQSSLLLQCSADNGSVFVFLKCFTDDIWSVIQINPKDTLVTLQANA